MLRVYGKIFALMFVGVFFYGCASSGVNVRGYVEDRPRVDQDKNGNAGVLAGTTKSDQKPIIPTRKIYVVEVSKETKEPPTQKTVTSKSTDESNNKTQEPMNIITHARQTTPQVTTPSSDDEKIVIKKDASGAITEYTVEKDDTLQKIAKKVYGSYGKWIQIYQANKAAIKNPDFLKPGTVIKIPKL